MTIRMLVIVSASLLGNCARDKPPATAELPSAGPATQGPSAAEALEQLDPRSAVPLLPMMANHQKQNMRDHLVAVQEVVAALAVEDYATIERAAGRMGFSEQMGQMCTHMGAGAAGFSEQAIGFHHTADRIVAAAHERNRAQVLAALGATLKTCTSCHAVWKQQVVDEPTWRRLTASAPPQHGTSH